MICTINKEVVKNSVFYNLFLEIGKNTSERTFFYISCYHIVTLSSVGRYIPSPDSISKAS